MAEAAELDTECEADISANVNESMESGESSTDSARSMLDVLKAPTPADIARKRQIKHNPPPRGKRRCQGSSTSDPKGVTPSQRVKEFPKEPLSVSGGALFCNACREEVSLKRSVLANHVNSKKHEQSKQRLETKEARERDIAKALSKHNA